MSGMGHNSVAEWRGRTRTQRIREGMPFYLKWGWEMATSALSPSSRLTGYVLGLYGCEDLPARAPSLETLCRATGLTTNTVRSALSALELSGYLAKHRSSGRAPSKYELIIPQQTLAELGGTMGRAPMASAKLGSSVSTIDTLGSSVSTIDTLGSSVSTIDTLSVSTIDTLRAGLIKKTSALMQKASDESWHDSCKKVSYADDKSAHARVRVRGLFEKLSEACGEAIADPAHSPGLLVVAEAHGWLNSGCDLDLDILPVLRAVSARALGTGRRRQISSWSYFRKAVLDARDARLAQYPGAPVNGSALKTEPPASSDRRIGGGVRRGRDGKPSLTDGLERMVYRHAGKNGGGFRPAWDTIKDRIADMETGDIRAAVLTMAEALGAGMTSQDAARKAFPQAFCSENHEKEEPLF